MILFLDIASPAARVGVVSSAGARWSLGSNAFTLLERLTRSGTKIDAVIVGRLSENSIRKPTWSGIRSAVAIANALSFAAGAKLAEIEITGQEKPPALAASARAAAKKAKKGTRLESRYSGEPNITSPKPR